LGKFNLCLTLWGCRKKNIGVQEEKYRGAGRNCQKVLMLTK